MSASPTGASFAYDPDRVRTLLQRAGDAATALRRLQSDDPAATAGVQTVRRTAAHLEERWIPALRRITGLTALTSWTLRLDPGTELALRTLVEALGGPERSEMRALDDGALLARLRTVGGAATSGPRRAAELAEHVALLAELARRLGGAGGPALAASLDAETIDAAIRTVGTTAQWARPGRHRVIDAGTTSGATHMVLATLLAAFAHARGADALLAPAPTSDGRTVDRLDPTVVAAISALPDAFPPVLVASALAVTLADIERAHPRSVQVQRDVAAAHALLEALLEHPVEMLALIAADPAAAATLATSRLLDTDIVTRTWGGSLGMPGSRFRPDHVNAFKNAALAAASTRITEGAAHGIAAASPVWLAYMVERDPNDGEGAVLHLPGDLDLGTVGDVNALAGQLLERPGLHVVLGNGVAAVAAHELAASRATLGAPGPSVTNLRQDQLGVVSRLNKVIGFLDDAGYEHEEDLQAEYDRTSASIGQTFDLLDIAVAGLPPVVGFAAGVGETAIHHLRQGPASVPPRDFLADVGKAVAVDALRAPLEDPLIAERVGLGSVTEEEWSLVREYVDAYDAAADRGDAYDELGHALRQIPVLSGYWEDVLDRLARDHR